MRYQTKKVVYLRNIGCVNPDLWTSTFMELGTQWWYLWELT